MNLIRTKYAFLSAYLKGEESRCITHEHYEEMLQRSSIQDMLEIIRDTDIGDYLWDEQISTFTDTDTALLRYFDDCLARIRRFKPPADVTRIMSAYMARFDILNIKIAARRILKGSTEETALFVPLGVIHDEGYLDRLAAAKTIEDIGDIVSACGLHELASIAKEIKEKDERSHVEGEIRLDAHRHTIMHRAFRHVNESHVLLKALGIVIDLENLQIVFRAILQEKRNVLLESLMKGGHIVSIASLRELLSLKMAETVSRLEYTEYYSVAQDISKLYEKTRNVTVVDRVIEKAKHTLLHELLSPRVMSPSAMLWYLSVKEWELRNVRMIVKGFTDGIPTSLIREHMVTPS